MKLLLMFAKSDQIEALEKEQAWKEEEFDIVLQFLRTVLLKRTILTLTYTKVTLC
jgi:dynein light intermediate chain 1